MDAINPIIDYINRNPLYLIMDVQKKAIIDILLYLYTIGIDFSNLDVSDRIDNVICFNYHLPSNKVFSWKIDSKGLVVGFDTLDNAKIYLGNILYDKIMGINV
jgi:hypothetical protein